MPKIGIGVTGYRRPDMVAQCTKHIHKHTTVDYRLIVHDDSASEKGVAASKNSCMSSLMKMGVDHVFLFDDDTWPVADDWWVPYVESEEHHLSYLFKPVNWENDMLLEQRGPLLLAYPFGQGCFQYYTRHCLETVGGMRLCFGRWGSEHLEHSHRICNTGLTRHPFQGLVAQQGLFYASDEFATEPLTAVPKEIRREAQQRNPAFLNYWMHSKGFVPWS